MKAQLKKLINSLNGKWVAHKVWSVKIEEPQMLGGSHTMTIEISVTKRKKKGGQRRIGIQQYIR